MSKFIRGIGVFTVFLSLAAGLWAVDSPEWGADAAPDLYAPNLAGQGGFSTSAGGAPASAINPAQGGDAQRIVFDIGFLGLYGLGDEKNSGVAIEAGMLYPTRYGVFGGSLQYIDSPFDSFPIKRSFGGNLNAAKEIYPGMSVGAGLNWGFGSNWLWTLAGDLGFRWNVGKVGHHENFFDNFTWAFVMRGLGVSWTPTWLTPMAGLSVDLLRIYGKDGKNDPFAIIGAADMSFPSLLSFKEINFIFKAGLKFEIAEIVNVSMSWPGGSGVNARELAKDRSGLFTPIPSVGIGVDIALPSSGNRIAGGQLPADGDLAIDLAFKPLYKGVTAIGAGATWKVGIADKKPPSIIIDYPEMMNLATASESHDLYLPDHDPAVHAPMYFSPNNDGKADYLEFPITITDERYVESWVWEITDEDGEVVRTFRNKELRPETQGFRNFFARLFAIKTQVEVPPTLRWDGIAESGELAPDGRYFFTITATDDSGNTAVSDTYVAVLKNAPPEISITPIEEAQRVFGPGGTGGRSTITLTPTGSFEDAWESGIYDSSGEIVRTFEAERGNPSPRIWDGRGDNGAIVRDGVYTYRIGTTDRAQNSAYAAMGNIVINTIRPSVSVFIADPWFSPNGDGIKDTVIMALNVPSQEGVIGWSMQIRDRQGNVRRTIAGGPEGGVGAVWNTATGIVPVPERLEFDGMDDSRKILEEGEFIGELSVSYLNGFTATALSPSFFLDVTAPAAAVVSEYTAFSPNYGGVQSEMLIRQEGTRELLWIGEIRRANGEPGERPVRSFRFSGIPPFELKWDGQGESGTFAADGEYVYELYSTDQAGNTGRSNLLRFRLSTADTPVMITTDHRAFAPAGNSPRTSVNMVPQIQVRDGVVSYKIEVLNSAGNAVRTFEGRGLPAASVSWNGRSDDNALAPEGMYTARLSLRYEQGNQPIATSLPFEVDNTPPAGTASAPYTAFAPGSRRSTLPLNVATEANDEWEAAITAANGTKVRTWNWTGKAPELSWDGRDAAGNFAADGTYQFVLASADAAGNTARYSIPGIALDKRVPQVILTASATGIAPKPNQSTDLVRFGIICPLQDGIESWRLELKEPGGDILKRFDSSPPAANGRVAPPPASIGWNGLSEGGGIREGTFTPALTVSYLKGDLVVAEAAPILVNVTGPRLTMSHRPEYFSPDNDGVDDELFISLRAVSPSPIATWSVEIREPEPPYLLFYRVTGRGSPTETIRWDGRSNRGELVQAATDYPVKFSATDNLGNSSEIESKIGVDVLVIRDGDRLKIQVPSIVFRENAADFNGIPEDRVTNNRRVIRRIAEILNKFRDYKIVVEGHANPVLLTAREEQEELQPLSERRAQAVMNMLIEFGVARSRLSFIGMGGKRTVVQHADRDNWWKNRRVEFILVK
ncbi:MAG: OmpA family protein [Treponema sp.]|nr:OmpA family protein [Treponema sp.]